MGETEEIRPVSISGFIAYLMLSLVYMGIRGPDKHKLSYFLNCNFSFVNESHVKIFLELDCQNAFKIIEFSKIGSVRSVIFHSKTPMENFKQIALEVFETGLQNIDATNNDRQFHTIDEWAKTITDIPFNDLITVPFKEELSLLIINQYFARFQWKTPFERRYIRKGTFTDIDSETENIELMRKTEYMKYFCDHNLKASIVYLPLHVDGIHAVVVVPFEDNDVLTVLNGMNALTLDYWLRNYKLQRIDLYLPKFTLSNIFSLKDFLEFHGLNFLFNKNGADLSFLIKNGAYLNDFIHASAIKINESGSYLSSSTEEPYRLPPSFRDTPVIASNPFIFYLYNSTDNLVLHLSVVTHLT
ncbi:Plasminogen activator inhibitor 1 [Thelohanellus kitauei]|uniref:Plasminogen activator inhibitor 1 n=1 Tax=Thelohanellus kitauei TaxID=669202 RepID=A0A0C2INF1_THEKT|nr:Plasminogen activator inhibitor 1 [Thelohanellus kitauei]